MKKSILSILLITTFCLSSCNKQYKMGEPTTYYASPVLNSENKPVELYKSEISLTTYNQKLLNELSPSFQERVESIHIDSDRYNNYKDKKGNLINNLKVVNDSYGTNKEIKISDDLYNLLELSITLHELSEGYFNPTMGSLIDLWDKTIPEMPGYGILDIVDTNEFKQAKQEMIPYSTISEEKLRDYIVLNETNKSVIFKQYKDIKNIKISLGGLAKGYGMYKAEEMFKDIKYPLMIDGGSSSLALINKHPKNETYKIGISSPYSVNPVFGQKILYAVDLKEGTNISTSGDYLHYAYLTDKKCDVNDEVPCKRLKIDLDENKYRYIRRHHILNPFTGISENYYRVINLHANDRADVLDALSTILFNVDIEKDKETFLRIINNFENYFNIEIDYLLEQEFSYLENNQEWSKLNVFMNEGMNKKIDRKFEVKDNFINKEIII